MFGPTRGTAPQLEFPCEKSLLVLPRIFCGKVLVQGGEAPVLERALKVFDLAVCYCAKRFQPASVRKCWEKPWKQKLLKNESFQAMHFVFLYFLLVFDAP